MNQIKKGSIVVRKSHLHDVIFKVVKIFKTDNNTIALLRGLIERVEADSPIDDLELVNPKVVKEAYNNLNKKINDKIRQNLSLKNHSYFSNSNSSVDRNFRETIITGKILHLDGDKKYSSKSYYYYKKLGLNAIVKNIPEYRQPRVVYSLLKIYNPDILIITGHDGMIKRDVGYYDIYNYRNSRHFINTVKEARRYDTDFNKDTVIFAGACQSYFEALISAGANFASSPARILIDFLDPIVIAEKIAITDKNKYISIDDVSMELRDGRKGVDGIGANGKMIRSVTLL